MQRSFADIGVVDNFPTEMAQRRLLEVVKVAVARISLKELAYRLDISPSLLADALAERSHKGVRMAWLVAIVEMADDADATAILNELAALKGLELKPREKLTPEQLAERYEEKLRSLGPVGMQLIRDARGGKL